MFERGRPLVPSATAPWGCEPWAEEATTELIPPLVPGPSSRTQFGAPSCV